MKRDFARLASINAKADNSETINQRHVLLARRQLAPKYRRWLPPLKKLSLSLGGVGAGIVLSALFGSILIAESELLVLATVVSMVFLLFGILE